MAVGKSSGLRGVARIFGKGVLAPQTVASYSCVYYSAGARLHEYEYYY